VRKAGRVQRVDDSIRDLTHSAGRAKELTLNEELGEHAKGIACSVGVSLQSLSRRAVREDQN